MLEHILSEPGSAASQPPAELPAAFAKGGAPYSLDELLSGLPPLSEPPDAHPQPDQAPAPLASKLTPEPPPLPPHDVRQTAREPSSDQMLGMAEPHEVDGDDDDVLLLTEEALPPTPAPEPPPKLAPQGKRIAALHALANDGTTAPTTTVAPEGTEIKATATLGNLVAALHALTGIAPPPNDDDVLVLTDEVPAAKDAEPESAEADGTTAMLGSVVAALHALAETAPPPDDDDDVLVLTDEVPATGDAGPESAEAEATTATLGGLVSARHAVSKDETRTLTAAPHAEKAGCTTAMPDTLISALRALTEPPPPPDGHVPTVKDAVPDDPPEWDPTTLTLSNLAAALHALAEDKTSPPAADDEVLELTEDFQIPATEAPPPHADELATQPETQAVPASDNVDIASALATRIEAIIATHLPPGTRVVTKGDATLPARLDALEILLNDPPPAHDFAALDALNACWPKGTQDCPSRALLAAAHNLSRNFGLPGKLPMASSKAWRMLSPTVFEAELAQRLADVGAFIADWQKTQRTFLILEFGEIELIEYLFEALHPGYHGELLAGVMNFKVLSNRRMGLLRRIPNRLKKRVAPLLPDRKEQALMELAHGKALLEALTNSGFAPIADAATKAVEEIEKMMKATANAGAPPPPPGGGMQLGRLG